MLGQSVVQLAWGRELGQAPLDHNVAQDVFIDLHLGVELTEGFRTEGKVKLPDLGLWAQQTQQPTGAAAAAYVQRQLTWKVQSWLQISARTVCNRVANKQQHSWHKSSSSSPTAVAAAAVTAQALQDTWKQSLLTCKQCIRIMRSNRDPETAHGDDKGSLI